MTEYKSAILNERKKTHGEFNEVAHVAQTLKKITGREKFSNVQAEAIDMICAKLARICCGDAHEPDHWADIAGYATLVLAELKHEDIEED